MSKKYLMIEENSSAVYELDPDDFDERGDVREEVLLERIDARHLTHDSEDWNEDSDWAVKEDDGTYCVFGTRPFSILVSSKW